MSATGSMAAPFTDTGNPRRNESVTSSGRSGASFGLVVIIHTSSGGAFQGSSSSPPSWLMCQMLASRL